MATQRKRCPQAKLPAELGEQQPLFFSAAETVFAERGFQGDRADPG